MFNAVDARLRGRVPATRVHSLVAPVGGLNDRDAWPNMPQEDAIILDNWWVEPSRLVTRQGSQTWATGFEAPVETLIEYTRLDGAAQLFAAAGGNIYDVTAPGEIGDPVVTGKASSRYGVVHASTPATPPAGSFTFLFNGIDDALLYDGTDWKEINSSSTPAITGVATSSIVSGLVFKGRLYMVQRNSLAVWYLPPLQIGGEASKIDLTSVFQRGGHIVGLYSWTLDSGMGPDDYLVALSSNGEVVVYRGHDPSEVDGFALVGVYYLGRPVGPRPAVKFGGDLLILCEQGLLPLSAAITSAEISDRQSRTIKIQNSLSSVIRGAWDYFGFEICPYPTHNALILNVPRSGQEPARQYIQNTITGAWTRFTGWEANTWLNAIGGLFFADADSVKRAWISESDDGFGIVAEVMQSFNGFKSPGRNKYFSLVRPYLRANGFPSIVFGLNGDFNLQEVTGSLDYHPPAGMVWGAMVWGSMVWGGGSRQLNHQNVVGRIYRYAGLRMKILNNSSRVEWSATDLSFTMGNHL